LKNGGASVTILPNFVTLKEDRTMSRGPGRVEKALHQLLVTRRVRTTISRAAEFVFDQPRGLATAAQQASIRRALGRLKAKGEVQAERSYGRLLWSSRKSRRQPAPDYNDPIIQMMIEREASRISLKILDRQIETARQERRAGFKAIEGGKKE
jgi:hypothetical protein